jgi:hypothetical protein
MRIPQIKTDDSYQHSPPSVRPLLRRARWRGHVISFHSPAMSPLIHATLTNQRQADRRVLHCLPRISEKIHHTYTISSRYKLWYGAGLIRTARLNRGSCTVSQSLVRLRFCRTNLCNQPRLCKGITYINLLGTKRMRVGTTTRKYKPISATNGPHARKFAMKLLVDNLPWLPGVCGS